MDLYREEILEYYKNPVNKGQMKDPDITIHETNASCGDQITLYLKFDKTDTLTDFKFDGHGCAISVATTSMLSEYLIGKTKQEIKQINLETINKLIGGPVNTGRIKCASLGLRALEQL